MECWKSMLYNTSSWQSVGKLMMTVSLCGKSKFMHPVL